MTTLSRLGPAAESYLCSVTTTRACKKKCLDAKRSGNDFRDGAAVSLKELDVDASTSTAQCYTETQ